MALLLLQALFWTAYKIPFCEVSMKLVMDERLKHRLIGIAVIVSIGIIFAPAVMKKSSQRFDKSNVSVKFPAKPALPSVAAVDKDKLFKSVKVAHVEIPVVPVELPSVIAKAEPLSNLNDEKTVIVARDTAEAVKISVVEPIKIIPAATVKKSELASIPKPAKKQVVPTVGYGVQLAMFTREANAKTLVNQLKSKGYKVAVNKVSTSSGTVYKVVVGQESQKEKAKILQQRLASTVQIRGFIVPTRIS